MAKAHRITRSAELLSERERRGVRTLTIVRGTFMVSKYCIPHLEKSENAHILMMSPPLDMNPKWFSPHLAYSIAKFGMSLCVLGLAEELKPKSVAVNALWPRTMIA